MCSWSPLWLLEGNALLYREGVSATVSGCKSCAGTRWESARSPMVGSERSLSHPSPAAQCPSPINRRRNHEAPGAWERGDPQQLWAGEGCGTSGPWLLPGHCLKHTEIAIEREGFGVSLHCCGMAAPGEARTEPTSPAALLPAPGAGTWLHKDAQER